MKTTYDNVTRRDGREALNRLVAKARPPEPLLKDIARLNRQHKVRERVNEYTQMVPDTTED